MATDEEAEGGSKAECMDRYRNVYMFTPEAIILVSITETVDS